MAQNQFLGTLEHLVMSAIFRKREQAYGAEIAREISAFAGEKMQISKIYSTLDQLEDKGFLKSEWGMPTSVQGGRAKKFYEPTETGEQALMEARRVFTAAWEGWDLKKDSQRSPRPRLNFDSSKHVTESRSGHLPKRSK